MATEAPKAQKGGKPAAKAEPPRPAADAKDKGKKKGKKKDEPEFDKKGRRKRKKKGRGFFILLAVIVVLLLGAGVYIVLRFDISGMRTKLLAFINQADPLYTQLTEKIEEYDLALEAAQERQRELDELEQSLNQKRIDLQERETALEAERENRVPIYRMDPVPEQLVEDMKNLSKTYANMDAATAARIIATLYSLEDMTAIIYYMNTSAAAAILTEMDIRLAAQITEELLKE